MKKLESLISAWTVFAVALVGVAWLGQSSWLGVDWFSSQLDVEQVAQLALIVGPAVAAAIMTLVAARRSSVNWGDHSATLAWLSGELVFMTWLAGAFVVDGAQLCISVLIAADVGVIDAAVRTLRGHTDDDF